MAYSEGRFLRVRRVDGGPLVDLPAGEAQIRNIAWSPDNRLILADGFITQSGWAVYDRVDGNAAAAVGGSRSAARAARSRICGSPPGRLTAARSPAIVNGRDGAGAVDDRGRRLVGERAAIRAPHRVSGVDAARRDRLRRDHRWPRARDHPVRRRGRSRPIPISTSTDRSRFRPTAATVYVVVRQRVGHARPVGRAGRRRPRAPADVVLARHLRADRRRATAASCSRSRAIAPSSRSPRRTAGPTPAARDVSERDAVVGSDRPAARHHLRHVAARRRRCELSGHRAGRGHHRGGSGESGGGSRRASCTRRRPRISRCAGRRTASGSRFTRTRISRTTSGCGRRAATRRRAASAFLAAAPRSGWPRWSPDGRWLLFDGASRTSHRSVMFVVGVDQEAGAVTREPVELPIRGVDARGQPRGMAARQRARRRDRQGRARAVT